MVLRRSIANLCFAVAVRYDGRLEPQSADRLDGYLGRFPRREPSDSDPTQLVVANTHSSRLEPRLHCPRVQLRHPLVVEEGSELNGVARRRWGLRGRNRADSIHPLSGLEARRTGGVVPDDRLEVSRRLRRIPPRQCGLAEPKMGIRGESAGRVLDDQAAIVERGHVGIDRQARSQPERPLGVRAFRRFPAFVLTTAGASRARAECCP